MKRNAGLIGGILVALCFGVSLYLRVAPPYDHVFAGDWIKFTTNDAYYYMRLADNLAHNFPNFISIDPYFRYPHGLVLGDSDLFTYLLGGIAWLFSLGAPTQHTVDMVGAYLPPILGALSIIPVFLIGRALFNIWVGTIAAGLMAVFPGELLGRTILGSPDRDALEVLLAGLVMLFLILAVKAARHRELTFGSIRSREWIKIRRPFFYSLLAGVILGIFILIWKGALIFLFLIFVFFIIQFIVDHILRKNIDYLAIVGSITFFIALIIGGLASSNSLYLAVLILSVLMPLGLLGVSWLVNVKGLRPTWYPVFLIAIILGVTAVLYFVNPTTLSVIMANFGNVFNQSDYRQTISETAPILFPSGEFSLMGVLANFTSGAFLSIIALVILIYFVIKLPETEKILFIVWSLVIMAFTLAMRRFALLFAINAALLTGYLAWLILRWFGYREENRSPAIQRSSPRKVKRKERHYREKILTFSRVTKIAGLAIVFFLVFYPNLWLAPRVAASPSNMPSDAWMESLDWLKNNTADPLGDPQAYYHLYETPYQYPEYAYGVTAWWDYGYWIARSGHRLTNCDPGGGDRARVSRFLMAQDEASSNTIIDQLQAKYIIVDYETVTKKLLNVATYAGYEDEEIFEVYQLSIMGKSVPTVVFYPEFYRSAAVRLFYFDGEEVTPENTVVISYQLKVDLNGEQYKEITNSQTFPSYEEAEAYISSQQSGNHRIVGLDPQVSPVPLAELEHYHLVYNSDEAFLPMNYGLYQFDIFLGSEIKIFEYMAN